MHYIHDAGEKTSRASITNVFKIMLEFKAMHKSTVMPRLNVIA